MVLGLWGCGKHFAYHARGQRYMRFEASPDWVLKSSDSTQSQWYNSKLGSLSVTVGRSGGSGHWVLGGLFTAVDDNEREARLQNVMGLLQLVKTQPAIARALNELGQISKSKDSKSTQSLLERAEAELGQVTESDREARLVVEAVRSGYFCTPKEMQHLPSGQPLLVTDPRLFAMWNGELVIVNASAGNFGSKKLTEELVRIAPTLEFDCTPPGGSERQVEVTGPAPIPADHPRAQRDQGLAWWTKSLQWFFPLFVALPAYLGALWGYRPDDPQGASRGAFRAVFGMAPLGVVGHVVFFLSWIGSAPSNSGMMSAGAFSMLVGPVALIVGIAGAVFAGTLAAMGAYQGARRGPHTAGLLAALATPLVVVVLLLVLALSRGPMRRYSMACPAPPWACRQQA